MTKDEVALTIEGCAYITIGDAIFRLNKNEMIVMPAKIPLGLTAVTDTKMLLLKPKYTHSK